MNPVAEPEAASLYEILGVAESASEDEIRQAYFFQVRAFVPREDPQRYQELNEAREVLLDTRRRGEYDQLRRSGAQVRVLLQQAALALERDPQKALSLLKSVVVMAPDMLRPRMLITQLLMRIQHYELAERQLRWLLNILPGDEDIRCRLARCLLLLKRPDDAKKELDFILVRNPAYHDAMLLLARIYRDAGKTTELIATLEAAIQSDDAENFADFNVLMQLLLVHLQHDNAEASQQTAQRLLNVIAAEKVGVAAEAFVRSVRLLAETEQHEIAQQMLVLLLPITERLTPDELVLQQELENLPGQLTIWRDALRLERDTFLEGAFLDYFRVMYRDRSSEAVRMSRQETAIAALEREAETDPRGLVQQIDYIRNEYPAVARDQETFLEELRERCLEHQVVQSMPVRSGGIAPELPTEEPTKKGILSRLFGGSRRAV